MSLSHRVFCSELATALDLLDVPKLNALHCELLWCFDFCC